MVKAAREVAVSVRLRVGAVRSARVECNVHGLIITEQPFPGKCAGILEILILFTLPRARPAYVSLVQIFSSKTIAICALSEQGVS